MAAFDNEEKQFYATSGPSKYPPASSANTPTAGGLRA
jgi:hypothetical protein